MSLISRSNCEQIAAAGLFQGETFASNLPQLEHEIRKHLIANLSLAKIFRRGFC